MARGRVGDISGLNPCLRPSAGSRAQMVLWAPPCQLKLGLLLSWGRGVELSDGVSSLVAGGHVLGPAWRYVGSAEACFGGRVSVVHVGEAGEVCARASGAAAGPKPSRSMCWD
eukprot:COSAG01_NODE_8130_length_2911_cov_2.357041_1_plen_113_part_00